LRIFAKHTDSLSYGFLIVDYFVAAEKSHAIENETVCNGLAKLRKASEETWLGRPIYDGLAKNADK
jgi:hypothetical protein